MLKLTDRKEISVVYEEISSTEGNLTVSPLNPGFGVTYGNAYRRVLLSYMSGISICAIKIEGVTHIHSSIDGVVEDVLDIVQNLKQVRLKKKEQNSERLVNDTISIELSKTRAFVAKDIETFSPDYEVCNPDFVICSMSPTINLKLEMKLAEGVGYLKSTELDQSLSEQGYLLIDCCFSPVINANYTVGNARLGDRTDFDKLVLSLKTDGTASPMSLIKKASTILTDGISMISSLNANSDSNGEVSAIDESDGLNHEDLARIKSLRKEIKDCRDEGVSTRSINCLNANGIYTIDDLIKTPREEVRRFEKFGKKSLEEVEALAMKYKDDSSPW